MGQGARGEEEAKRWGRVGGKNCGGKKQTFLSATPLCTTTTNPEPFEPWNSPATSEPLSLRKGEADV